LRELLVAGAGAEEERDAIVGSGDDEGSVGGPQALNDIATKGVADQQRVVLARRLGVDDFLEFPLASGGVVVETLGDKLEVDHIG